MKIIIFFLAVIAFFVTPQCIFAKEDSQYVTIVNPVRISRYNQNPQASVLSEYSVIKNRNLPATWLLTYDAIMYPGLSQTVKKFDNKQELGVFLEVTPNFTQAAGVEYSKTEFWHHANALFLSGYTQSERRTLIDKVFATFKDKFGYFPTSVGSWWTDSYSLTYMREKYGITANLGCADQFATDNYKIWGTYWSTPYYPSSNHSGMPGKDRDSQINVVNMQWAARDPLNGYNSSAFSTQDYLVLGKNLDTTYFKKLVELFSSRGKNQFGQIVVGLESDLSADSYKGEYTKQMKVVSDLFGEGKVQVVSMQKFSQWYQEHFQTTPPQVIQSDDLLGESKKQVTWYQSRNYRLGYVYDPDRNIVRIIDLRVYPKNFQEPYYLSPNGSKTLSIQIPSVIDSINNDQNYWEFTGGPEKVHFYESYFEVDSRQKVPAFLQLNKLIHVKVEKDKIIVSPFSDWTYQREGLKYQDYSAEAKHFFAGRKFVLFLVGGIGWEFFKKIDYLIPPGELDALNILRTLPGGKVMVFDNECLQCEYQTALKPPAFSNARKYVKKLSGKPIIPNRTVFLAKDQASARTEFNKLGVKYIYLVKFENYFEKLPFSPGDLGVRKIYDNANSEIWAVERN